MCMTYFTLKCCLSVYYDLSPTASPLKKNVHEHFRSMGSPSGLQSKIFIWRTHRYPPARAVVTKASSSDVINMDCTIVVRV